MNAKQRKMVDGILAELKAAMATRDAANDAFDADRFNAAVERVRCLEIELHETRKAIARGRRKVDSDTAALVSANID